MRALINSIRRFGRTAISRQVELNGSSDVHKNAERLPGVHDVKNAWTVCKNTLKDLKNFHKTRGFPYEADVLIAGGGLVSLAIAYYLSKKTPQLKVVVVERDSTYLSAGSAIGFGGFRSQFSLEENIELSLCSMSLLRRLVREKDLPSHLPKIDIIFNHQPYLMLANEKQAADLEYSNIVQKELGAKVSLLSPDDLKTHFPWLSVKDVELASYAMLNEGWINPLDLLITLRSRASFHGTQFVHGEIVGFDTAEEHYYYGVEHKVKECLVLCQSDGKIRPITNSYLVLANGSSTSLLASKCGIGVLGINDERVSSSLPVAPIKRHIFLAHADKGEIPYDSPIVVDTSGAVFVRNGPSNHYIICDAIRNINDQSNSVNLDVYKDVSNTIRNRVQALEELRLMTARAGSVDYNFFDGNWIIGPHPYIDRILFACGSSGMGIQHALAVGLAVSELILYRCFKTLDLSRLSFQRIESCMPLSEKLIA